MLIRFEAHARATISSASCSVSLSGAGGPRRASTNDANRLTASFPASISRCQSLITASRCPVTKLSRWSAVQATIEKEPVRTPDHVVLALDDIVSVDVRYGGPTGSALLHLGR
jgi:hypothetical protein